MSEYKLVPVAYILGNDIYFEGNGDINDYIRSNGQPLYTTPDMQVKPVGKVKTVGGYPDESEHTIEWLCEYKELKEGDYLYTSPKPTEQSKQDIIHLVEALEKIVNMDSMAYHSLDTAKITARAVLAAYRKQGGSGKDE